MGGICDLIPRGAPPHPRTAPIFGGAQKVNPDGDSFLLVAADLANSPDQVHVSGDIRAPPCGSETATAGFPSLGPGGRPEDGDSRGLSVGLVCGLVPLGPEVERLPLPLQMERKLRAFFPTLLPLNPFFLALPVDSGNKICVVNTLRG